MSYSRAPRRKWHTRRTGAKGMPTVRALIEKFGTPSPAASSNGDSAAKLA